MAESWKIKGVYSFWGLGYQASFLCGVQGWDRTQGFAHAKQMFYHWATVSTLKCYFLSRLKNMKLMFWSHWYSYHDGWILKLYLLLFVPLSLYFIPLLALTNKCSNILAKTKQWKNIQNFQVLTLEAVIKYISTHYILKN